MAPGKDIVPIWIDGESVPCKDEQIFEVTSSASNKVIGHAYSADESIAVKAAESAGKAFQTWKRAAVATRRGLLLKVADLFEQRTDELVRLQMEETSCAEGWAKFNVAGTVGYLRETAACISSIHGEIPPIDKPNTMGFVFREPIGVVLVIPPWNAALVLSTRGIATAIGAGCTVVLKASELSPRTHHAIVQMFTEAGVPPGVLNQIQTSRKDAAAVTEAVIANRHIRKVEFIGSAAVGRIIGSVAAKHIKPVLMELGGKCPAIVLEDADLAKAAQMCAQGAFVHHGQICFSTERIIVHASIAEEFKAQLKASVEKDHQSAGQAVSTSIATHAHEVLKDAESHAKSGEAFLTGGPDLTGPASLKPSIVLQPSPDARIFDEETFGPSASLYVVESDEEAIKLANSSSYGLNASVWTRDMHRFLKMSRELEYGSVHCNWTTVFTYPTGPQGGVKGSGFGRQNGHWGLEAFLAEKFVTFCGES